MVLLRVSYRVKVHRIEEFDRVFDREVRPLISKHSLRFLGIWRATVGDVGEYMELWEFDSMADFENRWKALLQDPELRRVFETTGPMVGGERFTLFEPAGFQGGKNPVEADIHRV